MGNEDATASRRRRDDRTPTEEGEFRPIEVSRAHYDLDQIFGHDGLTEWGRHRTVAFDWYLNAPFAHVFATPRG